MKNLFFIVTLAGLLALVAAGVFQTAVANTTSRIGVIAADAAPPPPEKNFLSLRVAWLAERESAVGDWESVRPPLRAGDEVQLTVRSDEDAWLYVLADSDGERRILFPAPHEPASLSRIRGGWQYALPNRSLTWRLDGGAHDRFILLASRHPLPDPLSALSHATPAARTATHDLELPLRDGRIGLASSFTVSAPEILIEDFVAR